MELINEQTELLDVQQTAEDQQKDNKEQEKSEVSLGKFKDVNALLSAYNSLQSEFTKRCQKIKELESAQTSLDKKNPSEESEKPTEKGANVTQSMKDEILKEYLQNLIGKSNGAIVLDGAGVGVKTPTERPKTILQAGELAKEILKK